ncbi:MAG: hypothetical protein FWC28_00620 [Proteobacteria bacterium]|nr:hypothetical protein [Cystobacterineae bacterium]MCL2313745.1 hypothetical protein [Pseudomonadota bacterium]
MAFKGRVFVVGFLGLVGVACSHGRLRGEFFEKGKLGYHVIALDSAHWERVALSGNDLSFISREGGFLLALNSSCKEHGDPSLEVLVQHLLIGFTERQKLVGEKWVIDGREGLRSRYEAKMDGVARELDLFVLKKDGCVFDFTYIAPLGRGEVWRGEFERMVSEFWVRIQQ